jgi:hypothetical protein
VYLLGANDLLVVVVRQLRLRQEKANWVESCLNKNWIKKWIALGAATIQKL